MTGPGTTGTRGTPAASQLADRLLESWQPARLELTVAAIAEAVALPEAERGRLHARLEHKVLTLRAVAEAHAGDDDFAELYHTLASLWLELRFEWERLNYIANFTAVSGREPEVATMAGAAGASALLSWLEEMLRPEDVDWLMASASQLMQVLQVDLQRGTILPAGEETR
ncbi:MAG: hypothetical protein NW201_02655 [Gemmatimonadales bacterium]|nr:hypothetical protein [Gemmatimonadales bacterium]